MTLLYDLYNSMEMGMEMGDSGGEAGLRGGRLQMAHSNSNPSRPNANTIIFNVQFLPSTT
jgi:hypothetical protein